MSKILKMIAAIVAVTLVWFGIWYSMMAPHVARVEASILYQEKRQLKYEPLKPILKIKYDAVYATGFPFQFKVAIDRPTLSMIYIDETFAASMDRVTLTSVDDAQGRYRVSMPDKIEAFYAKDKGTPEHYNTKVTPMPELLLSASEAKTTCGPMTGKACEAVAADAPIISYAMSIPKAITLHMELNGETRDEHFPLSPIEINVPVFRTIPDNLWDPLEMFVRVLREGLVYKTPSETKQ